MRYDWDEAKDRRNVAEPNLPFSLAIALFDNPVLVREDTRQDYGEGRMIALGRAGDQILVCVYTDRGEHRRIISLRPANRRERDAYHASRSEDI